jgi:glycosyltransferase involved in cell wall biosynthesis
MRVHFVASAPYGGGWVRSFWPAEGLRKVGYDASASVEWPSDEPDVLVVHRPLDPSTAERISLYRERGVAVLVDEDDDLRRPPAGHLYRWQQYTTADYDDVMELHDAAIGKATGLVVSTPALVDIYGPFAAKTWIARNYLPERLQAHRRNKHRRADGITVGWQGILATHKPDLEWIGPWAPYMTVGAAFETIGDPRVLQYLRLPRGRWHPFQKTEAGLYGTMARVDVGIVPLDPDLRLNTSKSWLKALEYMTLGIPVVATSLPEQRDLITDGVDGLLATDPASFAEAVRRLVADGELRASLAEAAAARAEEMSMERNIDVWANIVEEAAS